MVFDSNISKHAATPGASAATPAAPAEQPPAPQVKQNNAAKTETPQARKASNDQPLFSKPATDALRAEREMNVTVVSSPKIPAGELTKMLNQVAAMDPQSARASLASSQTLATLAPNLTMSNSNAAADVDDPLLDLLEADMDPKWLGAFQLAGKLDDA